MPPFPFSLPRSFPATQLHDVDPSALADKISSIFSDISICQNRKPTANNNIKNFPEIINETFFFKYYVQTAGGVQAH